MTFENAYRKTLLEKFEKRATVTNFLSGFAKKTITDALKFQIDSSVVKNVYAVDVPNGTNGRYINFGDGESNEFEAPKYNLYTSITADELYKRQLGKTEYDAAASAIDLIVKRQGILADYILNAIEKQAADAFLTGSITLVNGFKVNFNKKGTHDISASKKWNDAAATPIDDITKAVQLIITDSKKSANIYNLIVNGASVNDIVQNAQFQKQAKLNDGIARTDIKIPEGMGDGAVFHGQFSAGPAKINFWSYDQQYQIPKGFGFAGEGTSQAYIPVGSALLIADGARFDLGFAGLPQKRDINTQLGMGGLELVKAEIMPFAYEVYNQGDTHVEAGVESKPLFMLTDVDSFVSFKNLA